MTDLEARQALAREVQRALSAGGLSVAAASRAMKVEPKRLYRWLKGEVSPRLDEVERFANAINQALILRIGPDTTKEPPPEWAGEMERNLTAEIAKNRDTVLSALARPELLRAAERVIAQLEAQLPQGVEVLTKRTEEEDQVAAEPPGPERGSRRGRAVD